MRAEFVKGPLPKFRNARLYKVNPPVKYTSYDLDGEPCSNEASHVVVSAAVTMDHGHETYIFPADEHGRVISWNEIDGSFIGGLDHAEALRRAGYSL